MDSSVIAMVVTATFFVVFFLAVHYLMEKWDPE